MHVKQAYPYRKHKWTPRETYYQKYRYKALCYFFSAQVKYSYHGCFVLYLFSARWNIILTHRKKNLCWSYTTDRDTVAPVAGICLVMTSFRGCTLILRN